MAIIVLGCLIFDSANFCFLDLLRFSSSCASFSDNLMALFHFLRVSSARLEVFLAGFFASSFIAVVISSKYMEIGLLAFVGMNGKNCICIASVDQNL